jgi:hypothetical protein
VQTLAGDGRRPIFAECYGGRYFRSFFQRHMSTRINCRIAGIGPVMEHEQPRLPRPLTKRLRRDQYATWVVRRRTLGRLPYRNAHAVDAREARIAEALGGPKISRNRNGLWM